MGECYSHLSLAERRVIDEMLQASMPVCKIAARLGRHHRGSGLPARPCLPQHHFRPGHRVCRRLAVIAHAELALRSAQSLAEGRH